MTIAKDFSDAELRAELMRKQQEGARNFYAPETTPAPRVQRFDSAQRELILRTCCGGASEQEAAALIAIAEQRGLNPITGECYFVKRYDTQKQQYVWAVQASIDSFRIKADETGLYDGQDEPEYEYSAGSSTPSLSKVRVWRKGIARPFVGVARFDEYVQKTKEGMLTKFWKTMPHTMLAKCAEALAMRKAFPRQFSGIYTADEMAQAQSDTPPTHDADTGEIVDAPTSKQLTEMHLQRISSSTTVEALRQAGEAIKADEGRIAKGDLAYLRGMAKQQKTKIQAARIDTEPSPAPDALKEASL